MTIRVMLVDDHEIVRLGLITLINDHDDMEVVVKPAMLPTQWQRQCWSSRMWC